MPTPQIPETMRAWRVTTLGEPADALTLSTVTTPVPKAGEVLIRVGAVAANFPDVLLARGEYQVKPELPFVPGVECSGSVVAVGDGVTNVSVGDRVVAYSIGLLAEYAVVPAGAVQLIPDSLDDARAAGLTIAYQTAWFALHRRARLGSGEWLLVHAAAGGVGLLLTQLAALRGGRVIATASTDAKRALARTAGAEEVIDYPGFADRVLEITGGAGVAAVYDGVGRSTFLEGLRLLRPLGRMILYGWASGPPDPLDVALLQRGSLYVQRPTLATHTATSAMLQDRARRVLELVRSGRLTVRIGARYPLAEVRRAHQDLQTRVTTGKLLLVP